MTHPATITAIVSALAVIGPGIAWWVKRRDSRKDPIPKSQAAVALADSAVGLANETLAMVAAQLVDVKQRVDEQGTRIRELENADRAKSGEIARLTQLVAALKVEKDQIVAHWRELWQWVVAGAPPPPPTPPDHLRDVLGPDIEVAQITERTVTTRYAVPADPAGPDEI